MFWWILVFILIPFVEIALLVKMAQLIGFWTTLAIQIITGTIGATLARLEGLHQFRKIQHSISQGVAPADDVLDGILILVAGLVLLTPGLLTDAVGFLMLIPPLRRWLKDRLKNRLWLRNQGTETESIIYIEKSE